MHFIQSLKTILKNQAGAMFGMDARIALIIASVLAATGSLTVMSQLERSRVEGSEHGIEIIKEAIGAYYQENKNVLPPDIITLFNQGYLEETTLMTDAWGNPWQYNTTTKTLNIEDIPVTVLLATVHSSGKDTVNDSATVANSAAWDVWVVANDDIGSKFSTLEIDKARVAEYRGRGKLIIDKLEEYRSRGYLTVDQQCRAGGTESWCTNDNYTMFNFYPVSDLDVTAADYYDVQYDAEFGGGFVTYVAADTVSMQALMATLNLPQELAQDPWGRDLCYNSNITLSVTPPFTGSIWYSDAGC